MSLLAQITFLEDLAGQARVLAATGFIAAVFCFGVLFIYSRTFASAKRRRAVRRGEAPVVAPAPIAVPHLEVPVPADSSLAPTARPVSVHELLRNPATQRAAFIVAEVLAPPSALRRFSRG